jgi:hypothetical protein
VQSFASLTLITMKVLRNGCDLRERETTRSAVLSRVDCRPMSPVDYFESATPRLHRYWMLARIHRPFMGRVRPLRLEGCGDSFLNAAVCG